MVAFIACANLQYFLNYPSVYINHHAFNEKGIFEYFQGGQSSENLGDLGGKLQ